MRCSKSREEPDRSWRWRALNYQWIASRVDVMRTHVQPVSLHTRLSQVPGSARL